jgi:hypothetical protein
MKNIYGKKGTEKITAMLKSRLLQLINQYKDDEGKKIFLTQVK